MRYSKLVVPILLITALVAGASTAADVAALRPPKGSKIALVVFEDLECPTCARVHPQLEALSKQYNIPLVIHDFPIPSHVWEMPAAILARFFESRKPGLGRDFRGFIFANQEQIGAPCESNLNDAAAAEQCRQNLRAYAQRFATQKGVPLPFSLDPGGTFENAINADKSLGQRVGVEHTPTIYITTSDMTRIPPETTIQQLDAAVQRAVQQAGGTSAPSNTHKAGKKK
jgi:protein-disulfide isomerase